MQKPQSQPQINPRVTLTEEAYEDALAIAEALQWHAQHRHEVTLTREELERDRAA